MKDILAIIILASKAVLKGRVYKVWFAMLMGALIVAYVFIPVWRIPGNSLSFRLSLFRPRDYFLFLLLSATTSLLVLMQAYLFLNSKRDRVLAVGQGSVGALSALFGGLLATAGCSSCIAVLIGFLGSGGVFFVIENQPYVVAGAIALVLLGLYFSARRVLEYCKDCVDLGLSHRKETK